MFFVHPTPEKFERAITRGYFGFVFVKTLAGKSHVGQNVFEELRFQSVSAHIKHESTAFIFLRFVKRFQKAPFSWQLGVDGRLNRRNKSAFS